MDIRKKTRSLKKKYGTNNPFDIAQHLGIKVIFEPLGSISGYYNKPVSYTHLDVYKRQSIASALICVFIVFAK